MARRNRQRKRSTKELKIRNFFDLETEPRDEDDEEEEGNYVPYLVLAAFLLGVYFGHYGII